MMLFDTRCWNCAILNEDIENKNFGDIISIHETQYEGNGKFRCPNCMEISIDLSEVTYNTTIAIDIQDNISVLSLDPRIKGDDIDSFISDLDDCDEFKPEDAGVYQCEICWYYYQCGFEEPEWDLFLRFFSVNKIEIPELIQKSYKTCIHDQSCISMSRL